MQGHIILRCKYFKSINFINVNLYIPATFYTPKCVAANLTKKKWSMFGIGALLVKQRVQEEM